LVGFAKVTRDITERVMASQEREASAEAQAEFFAVTAHELRSPILAVSNGARLLRQHWSSMEEDERAGLLDALQSSGERLRRLVDDLLTASRIEAGVVELSVAPVDVAEVVREAMSSVIGVDVDVVVPEGLVVLADRGRAGQMVTNLVRNAAEHGGAPIEVRVERIEDPPSVCISVRDHGRGVPEDVRDDLFLKYSTAGGKRPGNGLGLFITRELARRQGGDAWYEDASPGARFVLRLPLAAGS
ncbi:MAG TPA: HAMP domain-containing sensor histidine kinase, partial [Acidimicrobiales bacterium]|nr:HAMP domain-containing sensor histidine kinase [Acidimicrobiales bacterium]